MEAAPVQGPAPAPAPAPAAAPRQTISSDKILLTILGGIVAGFSIGVGFILAQKAMKQTIKAHDNKPGGVSNAYGPRPMPRGQRPHPQQMRQMYHGATGEKEFDIQAWLKQGEELRLDMNNIPD